MSKENKKILLLIDANSLVHRLYHALPPLTAKDGKPIQSIYGLANILMKLFREEKPDYAAACFDRPEPTFRDKEYASYKAQRPETPDDLVSQLIEAHNLFPLFGIRTFEAPGFEADDLIATLAERFKSGHGTKVVILTGDLDTLQIVEDGHVAVRTFRKGLSDTFIYDEAAVKGRFGLPPSSMIDYKALVGDASDNIKGVPGIGPKTALELVKTYGSIEEMLKHAGRDEKLAKKLLPFEKEARLSKRLVTLEHHAPVKVGGIEELAANEDKEKLAAYFRSLGFAKLLERLTGVEGEPEPAKKRAAASGMLFAPQPATTPDEEIPPDDCVLLAPAGVASLKKSSLESTKTKVGFDLKEALKKLMAEGKNLAPPYFDLGVAFWLLDSDQASYDPDNVFQKFLKSTWGGTGADLLRAYRFTEPLLLKHGLEKVFGEIEMPLLPVLAEMELEGIGVSRGALDALHKEIDAHLSTLTAKIYAEAGEFNINSPKQLGEILFEKLALGGKRKTAGGKRSTDAVTLETLKDVHPIVPLILSYREDFKIKSTYVEPIQNLLDPRGRLHTEFIQTGTATGRLSSRAPNLQNIPQESKWAKALRRAFVSRKDWSFLSFDYSQIELRVLASSSGDHSMQDAFRKGADIHALTASKILGKPLDEVTKSDRRLAKTLNFGLVYGMGKSAFARASGVRMAEAGRFIENYFKEFSRVREWQEKIKEEVRARGFLTTSTGRMRVFPGFQSGAPRFRGEIERAAINFPIQSLASDIIKIAMIRSRKLLDEHKLSTRAKLILSIHDELLFEVRDDTIDETIRVVRDSMEHAFPLAVPLKVNVSRGKNWGDIEPVPTNGTSILQKNTAGL